MSDEIKEQNETKKKVAPRNKMPMQDPKERIKNFNSVALGYTDDLAIAEAKRCFQCKKSPCVKGCPVEIDITGFIKPIAEGDFRSAIRSMKKQNTLPAICGRVCPQETQCEIVCTLSKKYEPVAIGRLERFVADWEMENGVEIPEIASQKGKKVAVIGSGPAGLTCAGDLSKIGYEVVIFESLHIAGGVLMYGIPEFRLPKKVVQAEIDYVKKLGVKILCNMVIGKIYTIEQLFKDGYSAIFVGTGAGLPQFLRISGENLNRVYSANEYLTRINLMKAYLFPEYDTPINIGKKVCVVGAGNVAMDSARVSLRLGADEVIIVYRRSEKEMPARAEEIENAREEGVKFHLLTAPIRILGNDKNYVVGMECQKMELGEPDESGRRRPVPIKGSEFVFDCDTVVIAIGQSPNPLIPNTTPQLQIGKHGNIVADEVSGQTSMEGVYAGGDIVTGAATVISAMGAGKRAARAIDEYLSKK